MLLKKNMRQWNSHSRSMWFRRTKARISASWETNYLSHAPQVLFRGMPQISLAGSSAFRKINRMLRPSLKPFLTDRITWTHRVWINRIDCRHGYFKNHSQAKDRMGTPYDLPCMTLTGLSLHSLPSKPHKASPYSSTSTQMLIIMVSTCQIK